LVAANSAGQTATQQKSVNVVDTVPDNPLADTFWTLTILNSNPVTGTLTTNFDSGGGVNGFGGCNSYSASYTVNGNALSITGLTSGRKSCGPDLDQQEANFYTALRSAADFTREMGLIITNGSGAGVLEYVATGP
jgi:heat shock protein HslJ